ncbi:LysR substrate-binding domain-containing protein [Amycolatopsis sp. FDAARGOS 1241]|uniref:LysR substrate-binding domain-containing protein n=1 Tax=Amycolatopsis sp. FDAARGOS 1241 TaxID=2778070 RepID=UPI00194F5E0E|nr:LysR substrate-binding domain-containing protein [Amycolatopsis sp. FDAARGOS 1241]QRP49457.1 LysR family transcriptional regulator [Amycolatopsis sp. FDAARGOS 1241]
MELRHLRYFAAVAETCHFGRAAEALHMAQPALSHAVRQLENELGVVLLTRTTRQVRLTPAGEFFLAEARRVLDGVDNGVRAVRRISAGRMGLARIGFTGTAAFSHLPQLARTLQHRLPQVELEVHADLLTPTQCAGLRSGTLDLGLLRPPVPGEGLAVRVIESEPLVLAVPADHRLAGEPTVATADLRTEGFIAYAGKDSVVNDAVLRSCRTAGFAPRREHEAAGTAVLLALVAGGLGIGVVPASARSLPLGGVVFRDLAGAESVQLALAWHHEHASPLVGAVLEVLEDVFPTRSPAEVTR